MVEINLLSENSEEFSQLINFYLAIGFKKLNQVENQVKVHFFEKLSGLTLNLVLKSNEKYDFDSKNLKSQINQKLNNTTPSKVSFLSLNSSSKVVLETLKKFQYPFKIEENLNEFYSYDPLLNLIKIKLSNQNDEKESSKNEIFLNKSNPKKEDAIVSDLKSATRKRVGILTSGGDSSGMNAAVRAITRYSIYKNCIPYAIFDGYDGLVEGGSKIREYGWENVRGFLAVGGTSIGSARCLIFREREGRLKAAYNLIKNGIDALIIIGGDGSLTGANILRTEWKGLLDELVQKGKLQESECSVLRNNLTIVGLVGSIDNDMSLTDITIGAYTSLHRICESLDSLTSTALSHQRAFVVEVMGRHCGWLALMAAIAVGADWVFLPERPPPTVESTFEDWETEMCNRLLEQRKLGSKKTLVIVCEGAIDRHLKPIKPEYIKQVIDKRCGLDTRVTTLGHVQRGGTPCAFDRILATLQGVQSVEAVLKSTPDTPAPMIGMSQNKITSVPLMKAVELTHAVGKAISEKNFKLAMELRDPDFNAVYDAYVEATLLTTSPVNGGEKKGLRIGFINIGAPAGGMNAAIRVAARLCLNRGNLPIGIRNGFSGLIKDEVAPLSWDEVSGTQVMGGTILGTNRDHPKPLDNNMVLTGVSDFVDIGLIAFQLQKHKIDALLIIGGFEAFTSTLTLCRGRKAYPAFCIPIVTLPATVSNNVPGTDYSIGSDTALNAIVDSCDRIKLSANASRNRVFVVEVQGGNCG
ncbi:6-phosphofructokinase, alpha subunit [Clydaea vesicula]|uniref:6-phosphofructokinase n=1 Tax=Clydaea vesicula TaxID=447962 RepID=A0AAD5Y3H0_9FUNG|nr:6-phosphofructokinase, alpha subunit [Clydaea vesicula]